VQGRRPSPAPAVGVATASYAIGAQYTLPWYSLWALPVFAAEEPSPVAWVVWLHAAWLLAALELPIHASGSVLDVTFRGLLSYVAPLGFLVAFVVLAVEKTRLTRRPMTPVAEPV